MKQKIYAKLGYLFCEISFCGYECFDYECWEWNFLGKLYDLGSYFYGKSV